MSRDTSHSMQANRLSPSLWRHVVSILLLPFTVLVLVPVGVRSSLAGIDTQWTSPGMEIMARLLGAAVFAAGLFLFIWSVTLFARVGQGTLAPWDPTRRLVAVGPYRYVRNPMISAVAAMLLAEAVFFGSAILGSWCILFVVVNQVYFLRSEEPGLERRFGAAYNQYRREVPRWLPRRRRH
jgi:protein-S-isoprenylcysteine O-methyltransferase Ste14